MAEHFAPESVFQKVVIFNGNKILLLRQSARKGEIKGEQWDLPGGKAHAGETLKEAVKREVKEETGISLETMQLFDAVAEKFHDGKTRIGLIYFADFTGGVHLSFEHTAYEWVDASRMKNRKFSFNDTPSWIKKAAKERQSSPRN